MHGYRQGKYLEFEMAGGGSHWYQYRIMFNESNEQTQIYKVNNNGTILVHDGQRSIITIDDNLKFVNTSYECGPNEFELEWVEK